MSEADWKNASSFPRAEGTWTAFYPLTGTRTDNRARVERHCKTAMPLEPVLISSPDQGEYFLPPICIVSDRTFLTNKVIRNARTTFLVAFCTTVLVLLVYWSLDAPISLMTVWIASTLPILLYLAWNDWLLRNVDGLVEQRWMFTGWIYSRSNLLSWAFLFLAMASGAVQYVLISVFGANSTVLEAFGLAYNAFGSGEYWRALTGVFFHTSLVHWLSNLIIGSCVWFLYIAVIRRACVWIFFLSAIVSLVATYFYTLFLPSDSIGIVGMSGGIAGLLGVLYAVAMRWASAFPPGWHITLGFVSASSLLLFTYLLNFESVVCHASGFGIGLIYGNWVLTLAQANFSRPS